jgi:hypothetical protein
MELFYLIASIFGLVVHSTTTVNEAQLRKPVACDFFSYENAAKIIGTRVRGEDAGMTEDEKDRAWRCTFVAADENSIASSPKLHFMLLKSTSIDAAISSFAELRSSNAKLQGFEEWPGVGDEAVVHTDGKGFQFVMIRKGGYTIRLKVNPVNGASLDVVKDVAAELATKLK